MVRAFFFSAAIQLNIVFPPTDFVYTHMDLNPVVRLLSDPLSDVRLPKLRSTLPACSCLGIVLMSKTSKPPLKRNAVISAPNHTGTGHSVRSHPHAPPAHLTRFASDASDFQNSPFFDPDQFSGLGGWGDPKNDYQITDGGFADIEVSYPVPHKIRRNYTLVYPDRPGPLTNLFTPEVMNTLIHSFPGDFIGFQSHFETASHGAIHRIVGGCVNLLSLRSFPCSDPIQRPLWQLSI